MSELWRRSIPCLNNCTKLCFCFVISGRLETHRPTLYLSFRRNSVLAKKFQFRFVSITLMCCLSDFSVLVDVAFLVTSKIGPSNNVELL